MKVKCHNINEQISIPPPMEYLQNYSNEMLNRHKNSSFSVTLTLDLSTDPNNLNIVSML